MLPLVLWPLGITVVLFPIYTGLCKFLPDLGDPHDPPKDGTTEAYQSLFEIAHHDIWWAKEHAWTIITYIVGVVVTVLWLT